MGAVGIVGVLDYSIFQVSDLISIIDADEDGSDGKIGRAQEGPRPLWRCCKRFSHIRCKCTVFEGCRVRIARARRAGIIKYGLDSTAQSSKESGDILVVRYAVPGVIETDLDGL